MRDSSKSRNRFAMKNNTSPTPSHGGTAIPRARALIAVQVPARRRGILATCARAIVAILLLPVRIPVLAIVGAARGAAWFGAGAGRALVALGRGLLRIPVAIARLVAAPFVIGGRLIAGLARLLAAAIVGAARGVAWTCRNLGRGIALLVRGVVFLPVRIVVLLARLVALLARGVARVLLFVVRIPWIALRLLGRGCVGVARGAAFVAAAVAVPMGALAWGTVRTVAAGIAATARGIATAVAFLGRLLLAGAVLLGRGIFGTVRALAVGIFVCVRTTARLVLWTALLPFRALRMVAVALARGTRNVAGLLADAAVIVGTGLSELVRAGVALARLGARSVAALARPIGAVVATREPQYAALLPLGMLAVLGGAEFLGPASFPLLTIGLLILAAFACLALLSGPTTILAVILAWTLAVVTGWRAERISLETPAWLDALVYLSALAALRSAYVAARAFVRDAPALPRAAEQERAHRRASRAIGIVLAAQCIAFSVWSASEGRLHDAPLFGELLLVGAGMALAWVVRTGQYVRTAQFVLSIGAIGAIVVAIAAQFHAFAAGRLFTAASFGAGILLLFVAAALTVVVHTRLIDAEHGA
jgi:hypothetical protein